MGLFLTMAGVTGASTREIRASLARFAKQRGMLMEPKDATPDEDDILVLNKSGSAHTILWAWKGPAELEDLSKFLSSELTVPALWMHIHDGDFWMYELFVDGVVVDAFNPIPKYWDDNLSEDEIRPWKGDATVVAKHWSGVNPASISRYLTTWDLDVENPQKAYLDDTYESRSEWQLLDFMRKLGLEYPIAGNDKPIRGIPTPAVRQRSPETARASNVAFKGETFLFV